MIIAAKNILKVISTIITIALICPTILHAELLIDPAQSTIDLSQPVLISQWDGDDSYDPFADYSEFEESEEEESDVNFFRNGRLFTISTSAAYRGFTGTLGQIYDPAVGFGLYLTYFFDLRFAVQIGFDTGESNINVVGNSAATSLSGSVSMTNVNFGLKYFFNTQNVTRGLAKLSPYIIGGISQFHRKISLVDEVATAEDSAVGVDLGLGIEIPMLRGKLFFGLQVMYHLVNFADEKRELIVGGDAVNGATGLFPGGDIYSGKAILGVNF